MDYSKVNNALSGWVGSGSRRDREKAELGQTMQMMQMNQAMQEEQNANQQAMDEFMQTIQAKASEIAVRNEDRDIVQGLYNQEKSVFLAELEKAGNDPVKFMNSGGRKVMQDFYNNINNSDEVSRIRTNTVEVQKYFENLEGDNGANGHMIAHQSRRNFNAFMRGDIDSYKHVQLSPWDDPSDEEMEVAPSKVDAYLNEGQNYAIFTSNYAREYGLSDLAVTDGSITRDMIKDYAAGYIGANKQEALRPNIQSGGGVNKSYGIRVQKQFKRFSRNKISTDVLKSGGNNLELALKDFDSGRFNIGTGTNTEVLGVKGFAGYELEFAHLRWGKNNLADLDGDTYIPSEIAISDGNMYDEDGQNLPAGYQIDDDIQPAGIYLGYKIETSNGTKLVRAEDLEGSPRDVQPVLMQEYQDADWFTGKERYYQEIDTNNMTNMAMLSQESKLDSSLGRASAESVYEPQGEQQAPSVDINFSSTQEVVSKQLPIYKNKVNQYIGQMGIQNDNVVGKSLMLALAAGSDNIDASLNQLPSMFGPEADLELNEALVAGDSRRFFDLYLQKLVNDNGIELERAKKYLIQVDELRDKIQKAY